MSNLEILFLACALAVDAFSVAASAGPRCCPRWGGIRMAGSFGLFQAGTPLLGALAGTYVLSYIQAYDHWVAFGLLEVIGIKMLADALLFAEKRESKPESFDPSRGWSLLALSLATSLDAFGAGIGTRLAGANFWFASPVIGVVAAAATYIGLHLGVKAEKHLGSKAEIVGGLVLMILGLKMLQI